MADYPDWQWLDYEWLAAVNLVRSSNPGSWFILPKHSVLKLILSLSTHLLVLNEKSR